ncbi:MAG: FkbM family methyltransferase [Chthoniobacteraceae bacterium]
MKQASLLHVLKDHLGRTRLSLKGFHYFGSAWFLPWVAYAISPVLSRVWRGSEPLTFSLFKARVRECDLYTFANLFTDYDLTLLRQELASASMVIDAGANVGAFAFACDFLLQKMGRQIPILCIEPARENAHFLAQQPFASRLQIQEAALGPEDGFADLVTGENSVTHTVQFGNRAGQTRVLSLKTLCLPGTLLKMDVEGAEHAILKAGLPGTVQSMFLEWHPSREAVADHPQAAYPHGQWESLGGDLYGSSMWFWKSAAATATA